MPSANAPRPTAFKNWIKRIHVLGAPRSGGHFVQAWLRSSLKPVTYLHYDNWKEIDCSDIMLISLYRRDIFRQCLSRAVGFTSGKYDGDEYIDKNGDLLPEFNNIEIPIKVFGNQLFNTLEFHSDLQNIRSRYREHLCIYYEDWRQAPEVELKKIGLKQRTKKSAFAHDHTHQLAKKHRELSRTTGFFQSRHVAGFGSAPWVHV